MLSPYPVLKLVDFLNVAVTDPLAVAVDVQALGTTFPAKNVSGNVATILNGVVDFSRSEFRFVGKFSSLGKNLTILGQYGGTYNLHFYYVNNTAIFADIAIYIRRCEDQTSRPYTVTSFTGNAHKTLQLTDIKKGMNVYVYQAMDLMEHNVLNVM